MKVLSGLLITILLLICEAPLRPPPYQERKLKEKTFDRMPVTVLKVKNLQSGTWPNDLEIEIKNVSTKPIYFLNIIIEFPDDTAPNGSSGIVLKYGKIENMDIAVVAQPEDEHLDPGKTAWIIVDSVYRKGLLAKQASRPENFMKMELSFSIISFGDGTGFSASEFLDLRKKK